MYLVRKKFMYWHIPATTKVHLNPHRKSVYCFFPARLVKTVEKTLKYIVFSVAEPIGKTLRDRQIGFAEPG